jgi:hypothetical protein
MSRTLHERARNYLPAAVAASVVAALLTLGLGSEPGSGRTAVYRADGVGGVECNPWELSRGCAGDSALAPKPDPQYGRRHHSHA